MDDLNSTLSAILGDPAKMEQLRQVAQSLGIGPGTGAPGAGASDAGAANAAPAGGQSNGQGGGIDPNAIASILQNFQNAGNGGAGGAASGTRRHAGSWRDLKAYRDFKFL